MNILTILFNQLSKRKTHYFSEARTIIAEDNCRILHKINQIAVILLFIYYISTIFLFHNQTLSLIYQVFIMIHILIYLLSSYYMRKAVTTYWIIQSTCVLFIISIMAFSIAVSIYPFPERPGIFFPIFYLALSLIFMFPFFKIIVLMTSLNILYIICVLEIKTTTAYPYDIFSAITVWFISLAITYFILNIRLKAGETNLYLKKVSLIDALTGLPNRRSFNNHIEEIFSKCSKKELPIAIIMIDIDNFKYYNDTYGHTAGDECLSKIGASFSKYADEHSIYIARYGGEEIVVVLSGHQAKQAKIVAQGIQKCVENCAIKTSSNKKGILTISLGVTIHAKPTNKDYVSLINNADEALYLAKKQGRDQIVIHEK